MADEWREDFMGWYVVLAEPSKGAEWRWYQDLKDYLYTEKKWKADGGQTFWHNGLKRFIWIHEKKTWPGAIEQPSGDWIPNLLKAPPLPDREIIRISKGRDMLFDLPPNKDLVISQPAVNRYITGGDGKERIVADAQARAYIIKKEIKPKHTENRGGGKVLWRSRKEMEKKIGKPPPVDPGENPDPTPTPDPGDKPIVVLSWDCNYDSDDFGTGAMAWAQHYAGRIFLAGLTGDDNPGSCQMGDAYNLFWGASVPIGMSREPNGHGRSKLQQSVLNRYPPRSGGFAHADDVIADAVRKYPGKVRIVSVGYTNAVATFMDRHPDLVRKVHSLTLMGGDFRDLNGSWDDPNNFGNDPHHAAKVINTWPGKLRMVGGDAGWVVCGHDYQSRLSGDNPCKLGMDAHNPGNGRWPGNYTPDQAAFLMAIHDGPPPGYGHSDTFDLSYNGGTKRGQNRHGSRAIALRVTDENRARQEIERWMFTEPSDDHDRHDDHAGDDRWEKNHPGAGELHSFTPWASDRGPHDFISWGTASQLGGYWDGIRLGGPLDKRAGSTVEGCECRWRDAHRSWGLFPDHFFSDEAGWREGGYWKLKRTREVEDFVFARAKSIHGEGLVPMFDWHAIGDDHEDMDSLHRLLVRCEEAGIPTIINSNDNFHEDCARHVDYIFMELWAAHIGYDKVRDSAEKWASHGALPLVEVQGDNPDARRIKELCRKKGWPYRHAILNDARGPNGQHLPDHLRYNH